MNKLVIIALSTIARSSPAIAEQGDIARGQLNFRDERCAIRWRPIET